MNIDEAKIVLPDGRVAYDCVKLAGLATEGIFLKIYPRHWVRVRTRNTQYVLVTWEGKVTIQATKSDGSKPKYAAEETETTVHGSTWGGSMLRVGYIGVGMHLEFSYGGKTITTSEIESIQVVEITRREPLEFYCA